MNLSTTHTKAGADVILAAARDLFAANGFDAASMSDIARRAGSSKANVFHHFGSKEALYLAVMRNACRRSEALLARILEREGDTRARMAEYVRQHLDSLYEDPERSRLVLREILQSGPTRGRDLAEGAFKEDFELVTQLFREGQQAGQLALRVDPAFAAFVMLAANVMLFQSQHVLRHLPGVTFADAPESYRDKLLEVLLYGMVNRQGPAEGDG